MRAKLKTMLKNQKGMTLIELLAVIVILGIIAAIAIPSVSGIINKTKNDADISNGLMVINAAKIAIANQDTIITSKTDPSGNIVLSLQDLTNAEYLNEIPNDPHIKGEKYSAGSTVTITKVTNGTYSYKITLAPSSGTAYFTKTESQLNGSN